MNDPLSGSAFRVISFPPKTLRGWLTFVLVVVVGLCVAVLGFVVFLVAGAAALITAPFVKRRGPPPPPPDTPSDGPPSPGTGRVIDAEYEIGSGPESASSPESLAE